MRRAELFPADRGLQARMAAVALATPLLLLAALVAVALVLPWKILAGLALASAIGLAVALRARREVEDVRLLGRDEAPDVHAMVERLCVLADVPRPELCVAAAAAPNSWVIDLPGRAPRLFLTRGLLDALTPDELEAVVAHELAHVAHRDATVMSVVGLPGAAMLEGARSLCQFGVWPFQLGALLAGALGGASHVGTNALSRYRETSADAAAARITGKPHALAAALRRVSGELARIPDEDLRLVGHASFNLVQPERTSDGWGARMLRTGPLRPLAATHPPVAQRIAALEELERHLHAARVRPDLTD